MKVIDSSILLISVFTLKMLYKQHRELSSQVWGVLHWLLFCMIISVLLVLAFLVIWLNLNLIFYYHLNCKRHYYSILSKHFVNSIEDSKYHTWKLLLNSSKIPTLLKWLYIKVTNHMLQELLFLFFWYHFKNILNQFFLLIAL